MKPWLRIGLELAAVILLVPQAFVLCYYFPLFFSGGNLQGLARDLSVCALTISWVCAPFLALLAVGVKLCLAKRLRGSLTLLLCVGAGYGWVAAWNLLVFDTFSYGRATLPILLCSLATAGYALARSLYLEGLPPVRPAKNEAPDLSE
jgi:hypothetical protein